MNTIVNILNHFTLETALINIIGLSVVSLVSECVWEREWVSERKRGRKKEEERGWDRGKERKRGGDRGSEKKIIEG